MKSEEQSRARQAAGTQMRVLHAPLLVGGQAPQISRAERTLGLESRCIALEQHPFGYSCDEVLWDPRDGVAARERKRLQLLWRAIRDFDVVHLNFGTPILPRRLDDRAAPRGSARRLLRAMHDAYVSLVEFRDIQFLKLAGKALFVTYQGDDARQGGYCAAHFPISPVGEVEPEYYSAQSDARKRHDIDAFDRHVDGFFSLNPDLLHVLPKRARFLPYGHIDLSEWSMPPAAPGRRPLVIHAPSHRGVKGTRFVLDAVSRLQAEGVEFDFSLVEGLRHDEARKIYERADLLVDQLLLGWYGGLAVELMALGKPVVCYLREEDLHFLDPSMRADLPIVRAEPATIYRVLKECLTVGRHRLGEIGARGRAYVERWHDPISIARFLQGEYGAALRKTRTDDQAAMSA